MIERQAADAAQDSHNEKTNTIGGPGLGDDVAQFSHNEKGAVGGVHPDVQDATGHRRSAALNIIQNPLEVSELRCVWVALRPSSRLPLRLPPTLQRCC